MQVIDLSVLVDAQTPVYPGDPIVKIEPVGQFDKDGFVDHLLVMGTHAGTHVDAPMHMIKGGQGLSQFAIETFIGRGRYVRVHDQFRIEDIEQAGVAPGDIVLFHTGMNDHFNEPVYYEEYPAMTREIAAYLIEKKVKMVGLDTGSADIQEDFPIHKQLLAGNVLIIENLTNLQSLEGKEFTVYALPIKLAVDGAPARVVAVIR
jgi:kynurenine formamidase